MRPETGRQQGKAHRRAPNVLCVVWADVGIASFDCFGGLIEAPQMKGLAARGLRYTQWHTPALPAATSCSLLTGQDGALAPRGGDAPGRRAPSMAIPPGAATVAEVLTANGYRSYCVGKWPLSPPEAAAVACSRQSWPLAHGFHHFYGFLGDRTSQLYPDLVYDDRYVDAPYPPADGYHLTADLAEMAMTFIHDGTQKHPASPWFCYLALGADSSPDVVPREWADQYRGRFEMGYDRYRELVLAGMKRLGTVPAGTWTPAAEGCAAGDAAGVPAWQSLTAAQKRLASQLAESAAGLASYTDYQIGRILSYLRSCGQLDDTIVVACSANETDAGLPALSLRGPESGEAPPACAADAAQDCGRAASAGWARAFRTPYSILRQSLVGGSAPSPLIISWPREMNDAAGGTRDQYHYASDVAATILDCAGINPAGRAGCGPQAQGMSMRYTFTRPGAPGRRRTQLYQSPGGCAIYQDGWKAVAAGGTAPAPNGTAAASNGTTPAASGTAPASGQRAPAGEAVARPALGPWQLYRVSADRAELRDVAGQYPGRTAELAALFAAITASAPGLEIAGRGSTQIRKTPARDRAKTSSVPAGTPSRALTAGPRRESAAPHREATAPGRETTVARRETTVAHTAAPARARARSRVRARGTAGRTG
jgi:arylsulfatase A-like enzyme